MCIRDRFLYIGFGGEQSRKPGHIRKYLRKFIQAQSAQFYVVTGKVYNDSTLLGMEQQMNQMRLNLSLIHI